MQSILGRLHSSMQLLHSDVLAGHLVPPLQQVLLQPMDLTRLVSQLRSQLSDTGPLVIRLWCGSDFFQRLVLLL